MPAAPPLIKGYLPVRLQLPAKEGTENTFFFVREHQGKTTESGDKKGTTLFVANAPIVPGVSTKLLLKSIFGRFADVTRVTAVQNPRQAASAFEEGTTTTTTTTTSSALAWTDKHALFQPTFLPPILSETEGKFAHVVFASAKEMKKAKKGLEDVMSGKSKRKGKNNDTQQNFALLLDKLELQTLSDESMRQREEAIKALNDDSDDDDSDSDAGHNEDDEITGKHAQILRVAKRYRETSSFSRSQLMEECNAVMQGYENAEEAKRRAKEEAMAQPDEDGFVTVSYSNAVGSKVDFEESLTATTPSRRKGNKRFRKKKDPVGSGELKDFYRFQRANNRKRTMEELRKKFEEDVRKVKRLKEEKEYRPF